jgi:hypothetical protein
MAAIRTIADLETGQGLGAIEVQEVPVGLGNAAKQLLAAGVDPIGRRQEIRGFRSPNLLVRFDPYTADHLMRVCTR